MRISRLGSCATALLITLTLAACGGGGDGEPRPPVPTSTSTSRPAPTRTTTLPPPATATAVPTATRTLPPLPTSTATPAETATPAPSITPTVALTGDPILDLPVDETATIAGLTESVDVVFDELGIPHVFGPDMESVLFMQGYLTASVRFWQMDAFRRFAEGRLSEIFGTLTLEGDVAMRTFFTTRDGRRLEEALWERLERDDPDNARLTEAYTAGINAWLADLRAGRNGATRPPEYAFFLVNLPAEEIDDWRPQDTVAIGRLQAFSLSESSGSEIGRANTIASLPDAIYRDLFRFAPSAPTTVLNAGGEGTAAAPGPRVGGKALPRALLASIAKMRAEVDYLNPLGHPGLGVGSNNWIVAPALSASGHAMLANDPHLALFNPPIWHMVQLDAAGPQTGSSAGDGELAEVMRVNGVNFPGLPGVILGHNDRGAWGATVSNFDVTDVYVETVTTPPDYPDSPRTVLFNGEQVPVLRLEESFGVRGFPDVVRVVEVVPHHGPMLADPDPGDDVVGLAATNMTARWTGHEISLDSKFLIDLNRARNVDEFRTALETFAVGGQNWIWADVDGDIAYFPFVLVPQRPPGTVPYLPMPGTGEAEWLTDGDGNTLWLPAERIPQATNPAEGFIATANNDQIGTTVDNDPLNDDVYLAATHDLGFRAQRIADMLTNEAGLRPDGAPISMADMSRYQYDHSSLEAERLLPFLFAAADARADLVTTAMGAALDRLREWGVKKDGTAPGAVPYDMVSGVDAASTRADVPPRATPVSDEERADAAATSIFVAWTTRLARLTFADDLQGTGVGSPGGQDATKALLHILEDVGRTEPGFVVHTAGDDGQSTLWDDESTADVVETRDHILLAALSEALAFLQGRIGTEEQERWLWGEIHAVRYEHFFAQGGVPSFDLAPFPAPGGRFTVNPAGFSLNSDTFEFSGGPSMRFVVELDPDGIRAVNILPGGNNGNPTGTGPANYNTINPDRHYGDHVPGWLNGTTFELHISREDVAASSDRHVRYVP